MSRLSVIPKVVVIPSLPVCVALPLSSSPALATPFTSRPGETDPPSLLDAPPTFDTIPCMAFTHSPVHCNTLMCQSVIVTDTLWNKIYCFTTFATSQVPTLSMVCKKHLQIRHSHVSYIFLKRLLLHCFLFFKHFPLSVYNVSFPPSFIYSVV